MTAPFIEDDGLISDAALDAIAAVSGLELIRWRKADEEWPVPQTGGHFADVMWIMKSGAIFLGTFRLDTQEFLTDDFTAIMDVQYWAYLPTGPK